jgi:hypothetical protein
VAEKRAIAAPGRCPAVVDDRVVVVVVVAAGTEIEGRESQCEGGEVEDRPT